MLRRLLTVRRLLRLLTVRRLLRLLICIPGSVVGLCVNRVSDIIVVEVELFPVGIARIAVYLKTYILGSNYPLGNGEFFHVVVKLSICRIDIGLDKEDAEAETEHAEKDPSEEGQHEHEDFALVAVCHVVALLDGCLGINVGIICRQKFHKEILQFLDHDENNSHKRNQRPRENIESLPQGDLDCLYILAVSERTEYERNSRMFPVHRVASCEEIARDSDHKRIEHKHERRKYQCQLKHKHDDGKPDHGT